MNTNNDLRTVQHQDNIKDINNCVTRNKVSKERLKIIAKYFDIFEVIFIARYIDYKIISKLLSISQKTVERAFKEIRSNPYSKDLIIEVKKGKSIVVYAANPLLRLMGSSLRCPINPKQKDKAVHISKRKKHEALIRVLKHLFSNDSINNEISKALTDANFTEIKDSCIKQPLKQSSEFLSHSYSYQNYMVYHYRYDLLGFNSQIYWGDIDFDSTSNIITADVFCFSCETDDVIRTYDKALLLLESLKEINYKDCSDYEIKINYIVLTLDDVNIKEYIYKLNRSFRYYTLDFLNNYFHRLNLNKVRSHKWFFKIYRDTVIDETKFILFSDITGEFIEYGANPKKKKG